MNTNKATNEEVFQAKFFKHDIFPLYNHLVDLFNHVVHTGFPQTWSHHTIHPIHKLGSCYRTDCSLGKAQPKPQRRDNYGSIYSLTP